ncbi:lipid-A-disaccharide synthase N-terminal domain-containing protein [Gramella sp. AN32]|uniref:Lipid-A-disaccharide synthase N-terminal domain-containing protein n=1 Tax=Christiangramia antarctica TaxID=2058158 RepID=A0ABW5X690_9FLAO|nr:lipid-A-disaccharide synthase N-terminal domain-containing protein [Gramella sp. AN32]MCM4156197.1 lauroyl acyltransferase [Gramella sp. AN32]
MKEWVIFLLGFVAQILFTSRMVVQWILSEKSRKVITPSFFWHLSLIASFLLFVYGYLRNDFAIMLGQTLTYFIYIRNLQLQGEWKKLNLVLRIFILIFPLIIVLYGFNNNVYNAELLFRNVNIPAWLLALGIISQVVFIFRFIYQLFYSEKRKISSLPVMFWILSLLGSALIFIYAIFRRDPVLMIAHGFGAVMYIRNILIHKNEVKE